MAAILFTLFGSFGDLYPYLAIGMELRKMGFEVVIGTSAGYEQNVKSQGLDFAAIRPDIRSDDTALLQDFFDQRRGTERVFGALASVVRESYDDTLRAARARKVDAIVTHPTSLASVLVVQKLGLHWISSVLAPASLLSAYDPPVPAAAPWLVKARVLGPGAMRAVWGAVKPVTLGWVRPVLALRRQIGLPASGNPLFEGAHSPELGLALFSRRFAEPQPDWPTNSVVTGFPFLDFSTFKMAEELDAFLKAGSPPAVFTLGSSAVQAAGDFYSASLKAVQSLRVRALFLTGSHHQDLPPRLPPDVFSWPYVPHEQVFPRACAIVHQGGIGTTAQALRSGRPMVVVPFAHDQFDNAERARRLGVAKTIPRRKYTAQTAEWLLGRLLAEPATKHAALAIAETIRAEDGAVTAALAIKEHLLKRA